MDDSARYSDASASVAPHEGGIGVRFVSLALERYGHFENCELSFRPGAPDLHIIYGANEAGKTTSMAAVSDLLFGFPPRSLYKFLFDYSLLRVGAVLEEENQRLACRRKRGASGTLVDADDRPLDESPLLAMLRGQTKDTFELSFSLNQEGLRAGGRAMVEARNDLGRALFAAGSGLTGVSDELSRLEGEADAIWGPRASSKRSFTVAQRELEAQTRAVRDHSLKPKAWLDARSAEAAAQATLDAAQRRRDEVLAEISRAERIRRIAPPARLRTDHLASLAEHADTITIAHLREETAERTIADIEAASRAKGAAEKLATEATERMEALAEDTAILMQAEHIDELVAASGAVAKARRDIARLEADSGTFSGLVGSVERFLVANDLIGVDVVGSSMGARIVLELARRGRVGNVVALDPGGFWRGWERFFFHTTIGLSARLLRALRSRLPALSRSSTARTALLAQLSAKPSALSPELVCTELTTITDTPTFDALVRDLANGAEQQGPAADPTQRIVIGWGRHDRLCLPSQASRALAAFPSATLHWFAHSGHFPMWDMPGETTTVILRATS